MATAIDIRVRKIIASGYDLSATTLGLTKAYRDHLELVPRSGQSFNFLRLPREVRDKIYHFAIGDTICAYEHTAYGPGDLSENHRFSNEAKRDACDKVVLDNIDHAATWSPPTTHISFDRTWRMARDEYEYWHRPSGCLRSLSETCRQIRVEVFQEVLPTRLFYFSTAQSMMRFMSQSLYQMSLTQHIRNIHVHLSPSQLWQWGILRMRYLQPYCDMLNSDINDIPDAEDIKAMRRNLSSLHLNEFRLTSETSSPGSDNQWLIRALVRAASACFYTMQLRTHVAKSLRARFMRRRMDEYTFYIDIVKDGYWALKVEGE
ncbi:hypothetical protein AMS68_005372 [Peltaster fructicola]|uniref:Uncharacterized protein n=1 Tax=Peltaster fructicola TaxID=286661 RepID=A0A6H0XYW3_9PEZI|nr:hypothetical protein AMS68_005372 [Peltaster fructicola]